MIKLGKTEASRHSTTRVCSPTRYFSRRSTRRRDSNCRRAGRDGLTGDIIRGTPWWDYPTGGGANTALFDGDRFLAHRDNTDLLLKGSLFLSSERLGSHEIVVGYDRYDDITEENVYSSRATSSFSVFEPASSRVTTSTPWPLLFQPSWGGSPVSVESRGTSFTVTDVVVHQRHLAGDQQTQSESGPAL